MKPLYFRIFMAIAIAIVAALNTPAFAHHGWGDYDDTKPMTLKSRVVELSYGNPHASVKVDASGKRWTAILAPIARMESRGASKEVLAVGQEITLVGYPSRSAPDEMRIERLIVGDKTIELR